MAFATCLIKQVLGSEKAAGLMSVFVAKMLTFFGVMLYAGGPIDAVTLIASGADAPKHRVPECALNCPKESVAGLPTGEPTLPAPVGPLAALAEVGPNDNNDTQEIAIPFSEVGLRAGIGFEQ